MVKLSENEWAACSNAATMLEHLGNSGWHTHRKFRLFCCAAAGAVAHRTELRVEELLRVAAADAEGVADPIDVAKALACVEEYMNPTNNRVRRRRRGWFRTHRWSWNAVYATFLALAPSWQANEWRSAVHIAGLETWPPDETPDTELSARVGMVRDIFEDPFHPASQLIDPRQWSGTVVALAQGIAANQAFDRLPILADALEEAGCTNSDVLLHCRKPGEHVRGCWVVDLVLGLGVAYYAAPDTHSTPGS